MRPLKSEIEELGKELTGGCNNLNDFIREYKWAITESDLRSELADMGIVECGDCGCWGEEGDIVADEYGNEKGCTFCYEEEE